MSTKHIPSRLWWERKDLCYRKGRLFLANRDLLEFAQSAGTPVYLMIYRSKHCIFTLDRAI